jgi:hypothetical protein
VSQSPPFQKMNNEIISEEITDAQAIEALEAGFGGRAQPADTFCTHTVIHPVAVERKKGIVTVENRNFVTMGEYYPARKMEKAKDVEKRYTGLNKLYIAKLKARKLPYFRKDPGNLLNSSPMDINK